MYKFTDNFPTTCENKGLPVGYKGCLNFLTAVFTTVAQQYFNKTINIICTFVVKCDVR